MSRSIRRAAAGPGLAGHISAVQHSRMLPLGSGSPEVTLKRIGSNTSQEAEPSRHQIEDFGGPGHDGAGDGVYPPSWQKAFPRFR